MAKNLIEILEENDVRLINRGERWVASCPLHEGDRNPSFTVYPDMSYWCFGCKVGGDAITFLMDYKGMPYELAREYAGIEGRRGKPTKRSIKISHVTPIWQFLYEVADEYHKFLLKTPGALNYVINRGFTLETIEKYKVGYTDGGIISPSTAYDFQRAQESNVVTVSDTNDWWETMSHRITIPNLIPHSEYCDFIMGRTVTKSSVKYLGLRLPKPLYGLLDAIHSPVVYLVEGHFDWLMLKQWGYPAITGGGTNIPNYNLLALKNKFVVIIPDNDEEGMKAAFTLNERLPNSVILDYTSLGVKDVGELGAMEDGKEKFEEVLSNQPWLNTYSPTASNQPSTQSSESIHLQST